MKHHHWRARGFFELPVINGVLEVSAVYADLLKSTSGHIAVKDRQAASVYHPMISVYSVEEWFMLWLVKERGNSRESEGLERMSTGLESKIDKNGSILISIPGGYLKYAGINANSNAEVMRGAGRLFELWNPEELRRYLHTERLDTAMLKYIK